MSVTGHEVMKRAVRTDADAIKRPGTEILHFSKVACGNDPEQLHFLIGCQIVKGVTGKIRPEIHFLGCACIYMQEPCIHDVGENGQDLEAFAVTGDFLQKSMGSSICPKETVGGSSLLSNTMRSRSMLPESAASFSWACMRCTGFGR